MGKAIARGAAVFLMLSAANVRSENLEPGDLLEDLPFWQQFYSLRAGLGYSDNILFSDINKKSTSMLVSGFDATIVRLPLDGTQVNLFASVDDRRYFDGGRVTNSLAGPVITNRIDEVRGERTILAFAQIKHDLSPDWQIGLGERYFYQDQVIDLSATEADLSTLPVQGQQFQTSGEALWHLGENKHVRMEIDWQREIFEQPEVDDYSEYGPQLEFGFDLKKSSAVELSYQIYRRDYDTRREYGTDGTPQADTKLSYLIHTAELEWQYYFDAARQWRLVARGGFVRSDDGASGYFSYDRYSALLQLRYRDANWEAELRGRFSWYQYDHQLSDENSGERRARLMSEVGLRASRRLGKSFKLFGDYTFEQADSNVSYDNYTVNTVSTGIDWEF